jgi:hypothetical protein
MNILKSLLGIVALALLITPALAQTPAPVIAKSDAESDPPQSTRVKSDSFTELPKLEGRYVGPWVTTWNKKLDGTTNFGASGNKSLSTTPLSSSGQNQSRIVLCGPTKKNQRILLGGPSSMAKP